MNRMRWGHIFLCVVACCAIIFFSTYKLFESPETWMDEGFIIQSVVGLLYTGALALPVAPGVFESAWYMTTGFPVVLPLAGAFALFGPSLEVARVVMVLFLFSFFAAVWIYARAVFSERISYLSVFFLICFAPIYGNGRNVLGEVPGLLFIVLTLSLLLPKDPLTPRRATLLGVGAGIVVATKPIFILFAAALIVVLFFRRDEYALQKQLKFFLLGAWVPVCFWYVLQFGDATIPQILTLYANPHTIPLLDALQSTMVRFYTEAQPAFFLMLLIVWAVSYGIRRFRREPVSAAEEVLLLFSVLVLCLYLRTAGYYRYFFPAQVFALLYLPNAALYIGRQMRIRGFVIAGLLGLLLLLSYETLFRSWVAVHYRATRTEALAQYFATVPADQSLFIYQAPEAAPFALGHQFYQYAQVVPGLHAGAQWAPKVLAGDAAVVLTSQGIFGAQKDTTFAKYRISETIDDYVILVPKQR